MRSREDIQAELQAVWETIARVHYEVTWFMFKAGTLEVLTQLSTQEHEQYERSNPGVIVPRLPGPENARAFIESMRTDINDLMDAVEACALQMGQLLKNAEDELPETNEPDTA